MQLKIGEKEYAIILGFDAINYLDEVYYFEVNGIKLAQGVKIVMQYLMDENPVALYHMIKAGISTESQKPSNADIEAFISELGEKNKMQKMFGEMIEELKKQPLTKHTAKARVREAEKAGAAAATQA